MKAIFIFHASHRQIRTTHLYALPSAWQHGIGTEPPFPKSWMGHCIPVKALFCLLLDVCRTFENNRNWGSFCGMPTILTVKTGRTPPYRWCLAMETSNPAYNLPCQTAVCPASFRSPHGSNATCGTTAIVSNAHHGTHIVEKQQC